MPNSVQHSATAVDNVLGIGDLYIGAPASGPTSVSGFYAGINPPSGGYTVYMNKGEGGPSIVCPANDAALIAFTQNLTGEGMANVNACFAFFASQDDKMVMHNPINGLITDSLVAYFSPEVIPSYPRSGTTLYDLGSEGHNGTLENGGTFNSNGWLNLDGVDDEITLSGAASLIQQKTAITLCILFRMETLGSLKGLLGCLNYGCTQNLGLVASNSALQFYNDTTTCMDVNTSIVETGKWIYAVGTYDGTTTKINGFKEGVLSTAQTDSKSGATNSFTSEFQVFGAQHASFFTDGDVARASVYQKVLTDAEILQNYHQAAIVTDGLVGAFDAGNLMSFTPDDTSTTQDLVSSNTGDLDNGVAFSNNFGGTWVFDGVDDQIDFGNPSSLSNAQVTVTFWYNPTTLMNNTHGGIINGRTPGGRFCLFWINGTTLSTQYRDDSGLSRAAGGVWTRSQTATGAVSSTNQWYFIQITGNESTDEWRVGVDLNVSTTDFGSQYVDPDSNQWLLGRRSSAAYDHSKIANLQIYDRILSQVEIEQNYNANVKKFT